MRPSINTDVLDEYRAQVPHIERRIVYLLSDDTIAAVSRLHLDQVPVLGTVDEEWL